MGRRSLSCMRASMDQVVVPKCNVLQVEHLGDSRGVAPSALRQDQRNDWVALWGSLSKACPSAEAHTVGRFPAISVPCGGAWR